ncbi:MAG: ABC transporter ATP-binding protein [Egibacteraceae bacterium]
MLEARGVWFRYGQGPWVVEDADLELAQGEVVGLRGPSGCGKTTLARILAGYLMPHRGLVLVDGSPQPAWGVRPVQLIFQHPELAVDPRWRLAEVVGEAGPVDAALLDELSIARGWMDRYPNELSGGELQRIVVARALLSKARYLVADEISAMLDPITAAQIWHVLLDRVRRGQIGVLAISHDDGLLQAVADRVVDISNPTRPRAAGSGGPTTARAGGSLPVSSTDAGNRQANSPPESFG